VFRASWAKPDLVENDEVRAWACSGLVGQNSRGQNWSFHALGVFHSRAALGSTCGSMSHTTRVVSVSATTPSLATTVVMSRPDAPPLCTLNLLHRDLLQQYNCTKQSAVAQPAQPSVVGSGAAANSGTNPQPHTGSQDNSKLLLQQLNHLHLAFKRSQVSPSVSSSLFSGPAGPTAPKVSHPYPAQCH
jgi:hypothetical protein